MKSLPYIALIALSLSLLLKGNACSGYKITIGNKTVLGSNEDAWRVTPHIWFETAGQANQFGAAFTGSRYDGENGYAPQSGMNEMGLAFERLASYHPKQQSFDEREKITNPTHYLKDILHSCASIEAVREYISRFDHSYFLEDVFIYVDKSGKYLIVEPYSLIIGNEPTYVISNFCPSITSSEKATKLDRYRNGVEFLKNGTDTTLAFCTALSDTMHVCRKKIGDGTLLSSIWDLSNGTVNLYFYHDYDTTVQFNLKDELKKGDHSLAIDKLFPHNEEFEQLRNFKTPKNCLSMDVFIIAAAALFLLTSLFFLIQLLRKKNRQKQSNIQLLLLPLGIVLFYYMIVLSGRVNVFYFPAPYKDPLSVAVSMTSYIPFLVVLVMPPLLLLNYRVLKQDNWSSLAKVLLTANNLTCMTLIGLFAYWRFYDVFS